MADMRRLCEDSPGSGRQSTLSEDTPDSGGEETPLRQRHDQPADASAIDRRRKLGLRKQRSVPYTGVDDTPRRGRSMDKAHSLESNRVIPEHDIVRAQALEDLTEHDGESSPNGLDPPPNDNELQKDKSTSFKLKARLRKRSAEESTSKPVRKTKASRSGCCSVFKLRRKKEQKPDEEQEDVDLYLQDDPLRKRCARACLNLTYILFAVFAVIFTYSLIQDLVKSLHNPVRSIHFHRVKDEYVAPGIAVYPGGAKFLACGHYYNNVVKSKVRLSQLDLVNRNCTFTELQYDDPHNSSIKRDVLVVRGPTSFETREAVFLHFSLEDDTRDFFTVSYFVFRGWDSFNASDDRNEKIQDFHKYMPTFALSAGLRMWIKLIMSESFLMDGTNHTDFKVEYSVVKFWDSRQQRERKKHLFFIFFEWKNDIIARSYLLYTTTPWSIGAGLCGVLLTLQRGIQFAQTSYKRLQKDKKRRSIRKRTIRELKQQRSIQQQHNC